MAIRVTMTIALRDDNGVVFGTLTKVSDRHLQAESDSEYEHAQVIEFQFALEGRRTSVQGQAAVIRVVPHELPHGPTTYALRIVSLAPGKEVVYREWLYDLAHGGGTSSRPHRDHASSIISSVSSPSARHTEDERRVADLERRRAQVRSRSIVSSIVGSSSAARDGVGRQALRNALRGFAVRSAPPASDPDAGSRPQRSARRPEVEPIVDSGPRSTPSSTDRIRDVNVPLSDIGRPSSRSGRIKRKRMDVRVRRDTDPPRVEVRFADPRRYLSMYRDHLDRDVLFLRHEELDLQVETKVRVRIVLPSDDIVLCDASVGGVLPSGTGFVLGVDDDERSLLRRTAAKLLRDRH